MILFRVRHQIKYSRKFFLRKGVLQLPLIDSIERVLFWGTQSPKENFPGDSKKPKNYTI